jgi:hypothetical protein
MLNKVSPQSCYSHLLFSFPIRPWHSCGVSSFSFFGAGGKLRKVVFGDGRCSMVARGRVQNGVVVLDEGVLLPEGLEVVVLAPDKVPMLTRGQGPHSVLDIPTFSGGKVLRPFNRDDDFFDEMLEDRNL